MRNIIIAVAIAISAPAVAQNPDPSAVIEKILPPGMSKQEFIGDILAVIAFCNLTNSTDQYELSAFMRFMALTSADRPAIEKGRDKHYGQYRREITTSDKHTDFCKHMNSRPVFMRIMRRGHHSSPGSDDRRQPEKIEVFGDSLGTMVYCNIPVNGEKWGSLLASMGVKSESMTALSDRARSMKQSLTAQYGPPQQGSQVCAAVRQNPSIERFMSR